MELESRLTPTQNFTVKNTDWNDNTPNSLPWAVKLANQTAGKDQITFDFTALGNTPTFTSNETLVVAEEVLEH
ncbi:MAG: hypothetical protein ABGY75_06020, partial [Gemmataceae bacterium]